jgi:hypothetical protein
MRGLKTRLKYTEEHKLYIDSVLGLFYIALASVFIVVGAVSIFYTVFPSSIAASLTIILGILLYFVGMAFLRIRI